MRTIISFIAISLFWVPILKGQLDGAEVFLNQDPGIGNGIALQLQPGNENMDEILLVDLSDIETGRYKVFLRVREGNLWSHYKYLGLVVIEQQQLQLSHLTSGEYFFNEYPSDESLLSLDFQASSSIDMVLSIPIGELPWGTNRLFFRVNSEGNFSHYKHLSFIVAPNSGPQQPDMAAFQFTFPNASHPYNWFNIGIPAAQEVEETFSISAQNLELGEQDIYVRLVDEQERFSHYAPLSIEITEDMDTSVGMPEISGSFRVFPNPSSGHVTIVSDSEIIKLSLWDITGKNIYAREILSNETHMDTRTYSKGVYMIGVTTSDGAHIQKLIVK